LGSETGSYRTRWQEWVLLSSAFLRCLVLEVVFVYGVVGEEVEKSRARHPYSDLATSSCKRTAKSFRAANLVYVKKCTYKKNSGVDRNWEQNL